MWQVAHHPHFLPHLRITRSSSLVTLARPPTASSVLIALFYILHHVSRTSFLLHCINLIPPLTLRFLLRLQSFLLPLLHLSHHPSLPLFQSLLKTCKKKTIFSTDHSLQTLYSLLWTDYTIFWLFPVLLRFFIPVFYFSRFTVQCSKLSCPCQLSSAL